MTDPTRQLNPEPSSHIEAGQSHVSSPGHAPEFRPKAGDKTGLT